MGHTFNIKQHTIFDGYIGDYLSQINDLAERENVPYCIVGGMACQINMADALTKKTNNPLSKFTNYIGEGRELKGKFRPTSDIDILSLRNKKKQHLGETLAKNTGITELKNLYSNHIHGYIGKGYSRTILNINVDRSTGIDAEVCKYFIENAKKCEIPYRNKKTINTQVIAPEHLIVSKIGGAICDTKRQLKDSQDIRNTIIYKGLMSEEIEKTKIEDGIEKMFKTEKIDMAKEFYNAVLVDSITENEVLGNKELAKRLTKFLI